MLIGIDVGTTAVKAALFDSEGRVLKTFGERYATSRPSHGHAEQNPKDWMDRVMQALHHLSEGATSGAIKAIGLCSQVNTHVFVDGSGEPLLPALTWQDSRAAEDAARLDRQVQPDEKLRWWGAPLPIDASHVLARIAHVARLRPDIWRTTRWVLAPKDYCILQLTGEVVTDPMTCFGVIDQSLAPIMRLIDLVPGAAARLPPIAGFTKVIGKIRSGLPFAEVPVVTGAMDAWSGLFGAGVSADGQCVYLSGTSEILGIVSPEKAPTPGVIAFPKCEGIVLHAGPTQAGGASVEWLSRLLARTPVEISALAARAEPQRVPLFLPHLDGERAPLWDVTSRGAFSGLTSSAEAPEFARAVLEGVGFSARLLLESLEVSACLKPQAINHSGGGASSDIWCQIRADVLNRPLHRTAMRDAGVLGAALMARVGAGMFPSLKAAARDFVRMDRTFIPDPAEQDRHRRRFEQYQQLYRQLIPLNRGEA